MSMNSRLWVWKSTHHDIFSIITILSRKRLFRERSKNSFFKILEFEEAVSRSVSDIVSHTNHDNDYIWMVLSIQVKGIVDFFGIIVKIFVSVQLRIYSIRGQFSFCMYEIFLSKSRDRWTSERQMRCQKYYKLTLHDSLHVNRIRRGDPHEYDPFFRVVLV